MDKKRIEVTEYFIENDRSTVAFDIDELIDLLHKAKAQGALYVDINSGGLESYVDSIITYYERDKTTEEIEAEEIANKKFKERVKNRYRY